MTPNNIEARQELLMRYGAMKYAYCLDPHSKILGYLPRAEFANLNPYRDEIKIYQTSDTRPRLKKVSLRSEVEDIRLADRIYI